MNEHFIMNKSLFLHIDQKNYFKNKLNHFAVLQWKIAIYIMREKYYDTYLALNLIPHLVTFYFSFVTRTVLNDKYL